MSVESDMRVALSQDARPATVALMYHALAGPDQAATEPHYTLSPSVFAQHLACIRDLVGSAGNARDWFAGQPAGALITFDDGHASDYRLAFPALLAFGMRADFFVNPGNVGRPGFVTWAELREMAGAGMSIQSHGYDHQYLTALPPPRLRERLRAARLEIEERVGMPVSLLAPPGGRMPAGLDLSARACGYQRVLASHPGRWRARDARLVLPRMAVTAHCDVRTLGAWLSGERIAIARLQLRHHTLALAKRVLGDRLYERARAKALPATGAQP